MVRAWRKRGKIRTFVPFDPEEAPSWGLELRPSKYEDEPAQWWYSDGNSNYTVSPESIVILNEYGLYTGNMSRWLFEHDYVVVPDDAVDVEAEL